MVLQLEWGKHFLPKLIKKPPWGPILLPACHSLVQPFSTFVPCMTININCDNQEQTLFTPIEITSLVTAQDDDDLKYMTRKLQEEYEHGICY